MNITDLKTKVISLQAIADDHARQVEIRRQEYEDAQREVVESEAALTIIQEEAARTQAIVKTLLEEPVRVILGAVFDDPYDFRIEFVPKANRVDAEFWFKKGDVETKDPELQLEGGVIDVIALGLLIGAATLDRRSRKILILDEPMKHLKGDRYPERCAEVLKTIAKNAKVKILMAAHEPEFKLAADKIFRITQTNRISEVN